jgi:DNA-directed RNA polymerase omega subunit
VKITMTKPVESALQKISNRFLLTTVVARRWENIVAGAPPLIDAHRGDSKVTVVLNEIAQERVLVEANSKQIVLSGELEADVLEEPMFSEALATEPEKPTRKGDR